MSKRLAVLALLLLATPAWADILAPGSKWVKHVVQFEDLGKYRDYVFYVYPRDLSRGKPGNSSIRVPDSGEVSISGMNPLATRDGVYLFAVPSSLIKDKNAAPEEAWFEGKVAGVLKSPRLVQPIRALPRSDARNTIVTRYRVEIKDGLKLSEIKEEQKAPPASRPGVEPLAISTDAPARWTWIVGGTFAGAALVSAAWLAARRKV